MKSRIAFVFLFLVTMAHGAEKASPEVKRPKQDQANLTKGYEVSASELWLGLGAGTLFGFGSGQSIQGRWNEAGWPFMVADSVGLGALLLTFGDCMSCSDRSNHTRDGIRTAGVAIFLTSRLIQIGDLLIYGLGHGMMGSNEKRENSSKLTAMAMPAPDGRGALLVGTMRF